MRIVEIGIIGRLASWRRECFQTGRHVGVVSASEMSKRIIRCVQSTKRVVGHTRTKPVDRLTDGTSEFVVAVGNRGVGKRASYGLQLRRAQSGRIGDRVVSVGR